MFKNIRENLVLYAVTDRTWVKDSTLYNQVKEALKGGATFIQLREKHLSKEEYYKEALKIKELCNEYKVPFIINDDVELAKKVDADGVHVGQGDMNASEVRKYLGEDKIIGVSARTVEQALAAQKMGADYLGSGAVFTTGTKTDAKNLSYESLKEICSAVDIPVIAIGGINKDNILKLKGSGISGVAVVSSIFAAKDIKEAAKELRSLSLEILNRNVELKKVLTIAGSDCSGGAGIQADLKTMEANGVYGMSAITALTAQNTLGVNSVMTVSKEFLGSQLESIFSDIMPDAVKIGMVSNEELIDVIVEKLEKYKPENIIVDPVMVSTSGSKLIDDKAISNLENKLFKMAALITPNIMEAKCLSGIEINNKEDMEKVALSLSKKYNCGVLLKGGHSINDANDLLVYDNTMVWFNGKRINNNNTHGTGCTLSSAIASNMAKGYDLKTSVKRSKKYIEMALEANLNIGHGSGPLYHGVDFK